MIDVQFNLNKNGEKKFMKKSLKIMMSSLTAVAVVGGVAFNVFGTNLTNTANAQDTKTVIAKIGDKTITAETLYNEMKSSFGKQTLRNMLLQIVLENNVKDAAATQKAVNEEVSAQVESAGGEEVFQQLLTYQNIASLDEFKEQVYIQKLLEEILTAQIDTSDEALKAFYEDGYAPNMEAQHILLKTEEEANAALGRALNGETFEDLAKELSTDTSAANGGNLGQFSVGQMVPEFEDAVKAGKNDEVYPEVVKSQHGYHVIKVLNNGEKKSFDEVKEDVKKQIVDSKLNDNAFSLGIVANLVESAGIEISDKELKDTMQTIVDQAEAAAKAAESTNEETTAAESDTTTAAESDTTTAAE